MFVYLSISQSVNQFFSACLSDSMSFELTRLRAIGLVFFNARKRVVSTGAVETARSWGWRGEVIRSEEAAR